MVKRYTDSEKFRDSWYRKLSPTLKCFWEYMLAECDIAGIIEIDFESASFHIGADITQADLIKLGDRIFLLPDGKFFIPKFIEFQQGDLNPDNNAHKAIIRKLQGYGLPDNLSIKDLASRLQGCSHVEATPLQVPGGSDVTPLQGGSEGVPTPPSKSKGKSKYNLNNLNNLNLNTNPENQEEILCIKKFTKPTVEEITAYVAEKSLTVDPKVFFDYFTTGNWKDSEGKPVKNWKQKIITWDSRERQRRTVQAAKGLLPKTVGVKSGTYAEGTPL